MDQKGIVLYLHMRGMPLDAIREDLMRVRVLGENAVAHSTVTKYVHSEKFSARTMDLLQSRSVSKPVLLIRQFWQPWLVSRFRRCGNSHD
jgi:hypothetical protein